MNHQPVSLPAYWRLLRENRNFRLLWSAQIISEIGDWFYSVAIYSLLLEYTGSAKAVALAFVLQVLPQVFVAPTAGVINDRMSRRRVMIIADWTRAFIVLGMVLVRSVEWVWFLYVLLFLETIMWAVFEPARTSVIPNITAGPQILVGNALSSTTWSFNLAVGSALGGLVASLFGRDTVFVINSVSFAVSGLLIGRMRFSEGHIANLPPLKARDLADFSPILEGVRYVKTDKRLLATMLVKGGLGLMGTNWVLLPIFGEKVFPVPLDGFDPRRAGMMGMSVLLGCRGVGALLGPLIGNYVAGWSESRLRRGILAGFLLAPAGYFCLSVAPNIFAACASVILAHAGGSIVWVFSTTLLQLQTEDRFRGRVFSVEFAFSMLAMSTVSSLAGTFYDHGVSVQALAAATGVIVLLPAAVWAMAQRLWRQAAAKGLA